METAHNISPKNNPDFVGHNDVIENGIRSFFTNERPHAWLFSGPKGVGKATLAYRLARAILANDTVSADNLALNPGHPTFKRIENGSHSDLMVVEPGYDEKTGKPLTEIKIEDARKIKKFLNLTPSETNHRVILIDSIDVMNRNASNAILK